MSWIPLTFHVRKDVEKERITTCHSLCISLWEQVSWILFTFHVRKDVEKERITTCHSSLHFTSGHNHCRSISHNHYDHPRVILSRSISTRSLDSQVWRSSTCHFESINVNNKTNIIRARYLGPFHFVDHDGWDQTFLSCFWHRPTSDPLQCCKRFSLLACEKKRFYHFGLNNVNKQLYQLISSIIPPFLPKKVFILREVH